MIKPRLLSKGDRIAIIAPAGKINKSGIDKAISVLQSWGLEVVLGRYTYGQDGYFSGTDAERLSDLQNAIDDPTVAAIICARGGYGMTRIVDHIAYDSLIESPKWVIGFSDITALHLNMLKRGILSIHGDVGTTLGSNNEATTALKSLLFDGKSDLVANEAEVSGSVSAGITGGNLSLIVDSLGTKSEIDTAGKILFIEEVGEKTYRVDRMLNQLERAGKLKHLAGLAIGQFTDIADGSTAFGKSWKDCILNIINQYTYPVAFGFPIGHEPENYPLVHGAEYKFDVYDDKAELSHKPT